MPQMDELAPAAVARQLSEVPPTAIVCGPPTRNWSDAREARLLEREAALAEREQAIHELEQSMSMLKAEISAQPSAPEVAQTPKKRPTQRGRRFLLVRSVSPRKRSPAKLRSPAKARRSMLSLASTSASSSCLSPCRKSSQGRRSCSTSASLEEPPPAPSPDLSLITQCEPVDGALLNSLPVPLGMNSWDWPLSRDEKKALVLMFDRQELMVQRDEYADQLLRLKLRCKQLGSE